MNFSIVVRPFRGDLVLTKISWAGVGGGGVRRRTKNNIAFFLLEIEIHPKIFFWSPFRPELAQYIKTSVSHCGVFQNKSAFYHNILFNVVSTQGAKPNTTVLTFSYPGGVLQNFLTMSIYSFMDGCQHRLKPGRKWGPSLYTFLFTSLASQKVGFSAPYSPIEVCASCVCLDIIRSANLIFDPVFVSTFDSAFFFGFSLKSRSLGSFNYV